MNVSPTPTGETRCVHLRTKAMYISALAPTAFHGGEAGDEPSPVCWCNRTLGELGPDREPVDARPCSDAARACYRGTPG